MIAGLGLFVSSVVGFATVAQSLDTHVADQRVVDGTTAVVVSDDERCLVAT